jgi:F0F1-type ATP synthase assembly protein I
MKQPPENPLNEYLRYTGLGVEILACILVFAGGGHLLDRRLELGRPWFLLLGAVAGCAAAMYLAVRRFSRKP